MSYRRKGIALVLISVLVVIYVLFMSAEMIKRDSVVGLSVYCLADYWLKINHGFSYFHMAFIPGMLGCCVIIFRTTEYNRLIRYSRKITVFQKVQVHIFLWEAILSFLIMSSSAAAFIFFQKTIFNWSEINSYYVIQTECVLQGVSFTQIVIKYYFSLLLKNVFFALLAQAFMWNGWNMILELILSMGWCVIEAKNQEIPIMINASSFGYDVWAGEGNDLRWVIAVILIVGAFIWTVCSVKGTEVASL